VEENNLGDEDIIIAEFYILSNSAAEQ